MTLNLPLLYFVLTEEYCQTSPNKNKSTNLWHVTSILVCLIFAYIIKLLHERKNAPSETISPNCDEHATHMNIEYLHCKTVFHMCNLACIYVCLINLSRLLNRWNKIFKFGRRLFMFNKILTEHLGRNI